MSWSYKAGILPDQYMSEYYDVLATFIDDLVAATKQGRRRQWIEETFTEQYPQSLTDAQMIGDIFDRYYWKMSREALQCENCGRIWIQMGESNRYLFSAGKRRRAKHPQR